MKYPEWWKDGLEIVGRDGSKATLAQVDGGWKIILPSGRSGDREVQRYLINPNPDDWSEKPVLVLSTMQIRQVVYEADRAFTRSVGRNGGREWAALKDSEKIPSQPYASNLENDGYAHVRKRLEHVIREVLAEYAEQ